MAIGIVFLVLGIAIAMAGIAAEVGDWECSKVTLGWFAGAFVVFGVLTINDEQSIKPIDVYQSKTTLQYTIVDSVKVDSTVVWKIKEE